MSVFPVLAAHMARVALLVLLAGILWRGRARLCWSFALYVLAMLAGNVLVSYWPLRFFNASFWVLKQGIYDALKVAVILELTWRAFSRFPGAPRKARAVILALLVALALLTASSSTVRDWQPRVGTAALWVVALAATALMIVWYQVPVDDWQRAIMLGLAPYLLVLMALLGLLRRQVSTLPGSVTAADTLASVGLLVFWAWAAWRGEAARGPAVPPGMPA